MFMGIKSIHYFDNCATTKVDSEVMDIIADYATEKYFNPSARSSFSLEVANDIAYARSKIGKLLGAQDKELVFTSGGTEADNLAIFGSLRAKKGNIIASAIEHSAVYNTVQILAERGYEIRMANVFADGHIDVEDLLSKVDGETRLVCFMHISNETGAVNDVRTINSLVKQKNPKAVTFVDGIQAVGKIPVNLKYFGIDLYSFAGHKIHASKGIGCLYVKSGLHFASTVFGGGQERGIRSGTEFVGGIVGLAKAVELAHQNLQKNRDVFCAYKKVIREQLKQVTDWQENCTVEVSPAIMSLAFADIKAEVLLHMLEKYGIIVGTGSACSSKNKYSRLSKAIGLADKYAEGILRISFSRFNTLDEVDLLANKLADCVVELRRTMLGTR